MSRVGKRKTDQSKDEENILAPAPKRKRNEEVLSRDTETANLQNLDSGVLETVANETKSIVALSGSITTTAQFTAVEPSDNVEPPKVKVQVPNESNKNADQETKELSRTAKTENPSLSTTANSGEQQDRDSSQSRSGPKFKYRRLYRLLRRNEDPKTDGIRAKLPDTRVTIHDHVSVGSSVGSQYISTAASWGAITAFAGNKKRFPKIIATIDVEKLEQVGGIQFIDLTDATKREANLRDQRAKNLARKYEEVLITGEIPSHCIINTTALLEPDSESDFDFNSDSDCSRSDSDFDWYF